MSTSRKIDQKAVIYTIAVHAALLALLLLYTCSNEETIAQAQPLEGIPVQLGSMPEAIGSDAANTTPIKNTQPIPATQPTQPKTSATTPQPPSKPLITQTTPSTAIKVPDPAEEAKRRADAEAEAKRKVEAERLEAERKAAEKAEADRRAAAAARARVQGSLGTSGQRGQQGNPNGNTTTGTTTGTPGYGQASVSGRKLVGTLPKPNYPNNEVGTVVVQVTVNAAGNVTAATIRTTGTNTSNAALRSAAIEAARKAHFNAATGAPDQTGIITYNFVLN